MLTILIDDDPIQRLVVKKNIFRQFGDAVHVLDFENGQKVLQYFTAAQSGFIIPDVVFMDIHMPGMNGWQLLNKLMAEFGDFKQIDFYIWSCSEYLNDHKKMSEYPFLKGFLIKPVEFPKLFKIINDYLQKRSHKPAE